MAPKLRRDGRRRRRRGWAAPFVLTIGLLPAGACSKEKPREERTMNPPGPTLSDAMQAQVAQPPDAAPPVKAPPVDAGTAVNTPPPKKVLQARLVQTKSGCEWQFRADCNPGEKCNPPAPRAADCPEGGVPDGAAQGTIYPDGRCEIYEEVDCPKPPPGQPMPTCNPPPPRTVPCPK